MKILILGANGMLGHELMQSFSKTFETIGTIRGIVQDFYKHPILGQMNLIGNINVDSFPVVQHIINVEKPDCVINCIGIVKQLPSAHDSISSITINSLFPHLLAKYCKQMNTRVIHYSTDCVFSGRKGNYTENDISDAEDLYGKTKFLGELYYSNCLTLRTSIIGHELNNPHGLVEWLISQNGKQIQGYKNAIFSGLTTKAHGDILKEFITRFNDLHGVWHLAADPISKYDLLNLIKKVYGLDIVITPDETVICDRSLDGTQLYKRTGIKAPDWKTMINEMYSEMRILGDNKCSQTRQFW